MKILRVGVIGTGFIGQQHIEAIRRLPGTEVTAIVERNKTLAQAAGEQWGIAKCFDDYRELLNDDTVDVIHNCTPNSSHYAINRDIIASGKHVYCEKPLALTSEESAALVKLADQHHVAAGVNFHYRHNAMVQEMRERVVNGCIGTPLIVHGAYLQDWMLYETDFNWRIDPKIGGPSRAIADIGSHCFDTAQFVLGKKITSVYAHLITVYPIRKRCETVGDTFSSQTGKVLESIPVHTEDAAFVMVKFENGIPGMFNLSQVCAGRKNGLELTVSGGNASLSWQQENADKLWIGHRDTPNEQMYADKKYLTGNAKRYATLPGGHSVAWHDALRNAIHSFYTSIRNGKYAQPYQDYTTFHDGHRILKITEACLQSSRAGHWVDV